MIYTLTFSPSVDYIVEVDHFRVGEINRTAAEKVVPGGKGLNVSMVLSNLGHESVALGFLAGFTGREIEKRLRESGCRTDFIHVREGFSRINLKMISNGETAINGQEPKITPGDIAKLEKKTGAAAGGRHPRDLRKHPEYAAGGYVRTDPGGSCRPAGGAAGHPA